MDALDQIPALSHSRIAPVQVVPPADMLIIVPGTLTFPPTVNYVLGRYQAAKPAVPGTPAKGMPGLQSFQPEVPGTPAVPEGCDIIDKGTYQLTPQEWAAWKNQNDGNYVLGLVAKHLGVKLE